jgi:hypothetical protein
MKHFELKNVAQVQLVTFELVHESMYVCQLDLKFKFDTSTRYNVVYL